MVYGIIGMINFAHGEVYMIGSYVAFIVLAGLAMVLERMPADYPDRAKYLAQ